MKNSLLKMLLLVGFIAFPVAALADRSGGCSLTNTNHHDGCWRLGQGNSILHRDGSSWQRVPGSATDVGNGWVIGTDRRSGGYGIYRWNGYKWKRVSGSAVSIGGSYQSPWVVNNRGERFSWTGRAWRRDGHTPGYNRHEYNSHSGGYRDTRRHHNSRHNQQDPHRSNRHRDRR